MPKVIIAAGTSDARQIISELTKLDKIKVIATVTTRFGSELIGGNEGVVVLEGKLGLEGMVQLIKEAEALCLIDATHPFAREASLNAIKACDITGIPYLRYERSGAGGQEQTGIIRVRDFEEAVEAAVKFEGNIFLAIGSNNLSTFIKKIPDFRQRLTVRVLPDSRVIAKCEEAGLTAANIAAMKGPFSEGLNMEMLKQYKASVLVTKDSGNAGGVDSKISAAVKLGIPVVMVERPEVHYTRMVTSVEDVIDFVKKALFSGGIF